MSKHTKLALLVVVLVLAVVPAAFAGLSNVGVSPDFNSVTTSNGFPQWYTDANGVTVDLPTPAPIGDGLTAPTMVYQPLVLGVSNAVALRAGFDTEAFYFNAKANPKGFQTAYGRIVMIAGLEASYANLTPTEGQQVVFARIRIKAPVKVAGTYTLTHPWGSETINVSAADINSTNKGIFFTKDFGLNTGWNPAGAGVWSPVPPPGGFYSVLQSGNTMSTFLRALSPAPQAGWIGDGVTLSTVTGSPTGYNTVRLQGPDPNLDGKGHNFVETSLWVVSGHIPASTAVPLPLSVDRVTCSYIGPVENVDLFLSSRPGATVTVTDNKAPFPVLYSGAVTDPSGKFYKSFPGTTKSITVAVTSADPGFTPTTKTVRVIDYVNITSAVYSQGGTTPTLTVTATSSDFFSAAKNGRLAPTLTVTGFGNMTVDASGTYTLGPVAVTSPLPPSITVNSTTGGTDAIAVAITQ